MPNLKWLSSREILVNPTGRHQIDFQQEFPLVVNCFQYSLEHRLIPNFHDYFEIAYVYAGKGILRVEDKEFALRSGDILVVGNSQFHTVQVKNREDLRIVCLYFMPELVYAPGAAPIDFEYVRPFYDQSISFGNRISPGHINHKAILKNMLFIGKNLHARSQFSFLHAKNALLQVLLPLAQYYGQFSGKSSREYRQRITKIEKLKPALAFLHASFDQPVSLKKTAEKAFCSPSHFCKLFKKVTGHHFAEYVNRLRISKAKELLLKGDPAIGQVALEVGFKNHSNFDRAFRKITGYTPQYFVLHASR